MSVWSLCASFLPVDLFEHISAVLACRRSVTGPSPHTVWWEAGGAAIWAHFKCRESWHSCFQPFFVLFVYSALTLRPLSGRRCERCSSSNVIHAQLSAALRPNRYKSFIIGPVKQRVAPGDLIYLPACFPAQKNGSTCQLLSQWWILRGNLVRADFVRCSKNHPKLVGGKVLIGCTATLNYAVKSVLWWKRKHTLSLMSVRRSDGGKK